MNTRAITAIRPVRGTRVHLLRSGKSSAGVPTWCGRYLVGEPEEVNWSEISGEDQCTYCSIALLKSRRRGSRI